MKITSLRLLLLVLLLGLGLSGPSGPGVFRPAAARALDEETRLAKEKQLEDIKTDLAAKKQQLNVLKAKEKNALDELLSTRKKLTQTQGEKRYTLYQLRQTERKKQVTALELAAARNQLDQELAAFKSRIREIYKAGQSSYLEVVFSSQTLSDFLSRSFFFEKVMGRDLSLMNEIRSRQATVADRERSLTAQTAEIKQLAEIIQGKERQVASQAEKQSAIHESILQKRLEYERMVAEEEENSRQIEAFIKGWESKGQKNTPAGTGHLIWPVPQHRITSGYGYRRHPIFRVVKFHSGIDLAAPYGQQISAADSGIVSEAKYWGGYGNMIVIDHGRGISTVYAHLSRFYVQSGQKVNKGDTIGLVGSTGYSTGPHLHFEVRVGGSTANPLSYLP